MNGSKPAKITWLIIANAVKAEVYQLNHQEHTLIETLNHPESRLKTGDLTSDKPGSYRTDGSASGQYASHNNPHEDQKKHFAKELADFLENKRQKHAFTGLIMCSESHFHGLLNQCMTNSVQSLIIKTIEKDYIPLPKLKLNAAIAAIIHEGF